MLKSEAETALHRRFYAVRMFRKCTIKWWVVMLSSHASYFGGPGLVSGAGHNNEGLVQLFATALVTDISDSGVKCERFHSRAHGPWRWRHRNVSNCVKICTTSYPRKPLPLYPRKPVSSSTLLWQSQIFLILYEHFRRSSLRSFIAGDSLQATMRDRRFSQR